MCFLKFILKCSILVTLKHIEYHKRFLALGKFLFFFDTVYVRYQDNVCIFFHCFIGGPVVVRVCDIPVRREFDTLGVATIGLSIVNQLHVTIECSV